MADNLLDNWTFYNHIPHSLLLALPPDKCPPLVNSPFGDFVV